MEDFRCSIFDYLNVGVGEREYVVVFDESKQIFDSFLNFSKENAERLKELKSSGTLLSGDLPCGFSTNEVMSNFDKQTCLAFLKITNSNKFFKSYERC